MNKTSVSLRLLDRLTKMLTFSNKVGITFTLPTFLKFCTSQEMLVKNSEGVQMAMTI